MILTPNFTAMTPTATIHSIAISELLHKQITSRKTPGLYYAFFDAQKIHYEFSDGKMDLKAGIPVDAQTVFHAYSMTKTFTATAVMQLVATGKLNLEDLVTTHLPDFAHGHEIRIWHLLAHSSGLPNPMPIKWIHLVEEQATFDENAFFEGVFRAISKPSRKPNDRFAYSNLGFVVLGQLIEQVTGMSYREYVNQHIIKPLSASDALGFERQSHWKVATGYQKAFSFGNFLLGFLLDKAKFRGEKTEGWVSLRPFYVNGSAYGGLIGRPGAFVAFAQDLLKLDGVVLPPKYRQEMFQENHLNSGKASGMCLGWFCGLLDGRRYVTHAGGGGGYYCELRIYPESGLGSIIMTNRTGFSDERMLDKLDKFCLPTSAL